jgi:glyoxylase-like metal-dependent hydrolase (beta-lactamase superfamily II)
MNVSLYVLFALSFLTFSLPANAQFATGSMDVRWNVGVANCKTNPQPPLQVHAYNDQTFILRENLCSTFEAPFMYLMIGASRALLIDTGDVAEAQQVPLAATVMRLLPGDGQSKLPLLVVHTHRHLDHRGGDAQFQNLPNVQVAPYDLDGVQKYFGFRDWPDQPAKLDLGSRVIDILPTPGHNPTHICFYDRNTAILFSGDFLLPGRLLIDDKRADLASAERVAAFVRDKPISYILGGHIELDSSGKTFRWKSHYHPQEHLLPLTRNDVLALPEAIRHFNGISTKQGGFIMVGQTGLFLSVLEEWME